MKGLLVLGSLVALLAASASGGGAATRPFPGSASWADARLGWAPYHGEWRCNRAFTTTVDDNGRVCATENGGQSWRTIFVGGNYILGLVRTSVNAGIVSTGAHGHFQYWTRDNGRHWFWTEVVGGVGGFHAPGVTFLGRGDRLYWADHATGTVFQVTPWPPTGAAACAGQWSRSILVDDAHPDGNICVGPPVEAGMRSTPVVSGHGHILRWALVPDGVAAVFERDDRGLTAVVRRGDATTVRALPAPGLPADAHGSAQRLRVDWPELVVESLFYSGSEARDSWEVVWRSRDGGASWTVASEPSWRWHSFNPIARAGTAAGAVDDEIVLAGGRFSAHEPSSGANSTGAVSRLVQAYRPADDTWRRLPDLPVPVGYAAGAATGSELFVVGGFDARQRPRRSAYVLRDGRWRGLPPTPEPRAAAGAAIVGQRLYVIGGIGRRGLARTTLVFDIRTNRWSTAPGPRPRAYLGVAAAGGRIFALGGRVAGAGTEVSLAESWRPGERRWRRLPPLPSRRSDTAAVGFGDAIVSLGGADTEYYRPIGSAAVLEPGSGSWRRLPTLRTPRYGLAAAIHGSRIYALVGGDGDGHGDKGTLNESLLLEP